MHGKIHLPQALQIGLNAISDTFFVMVCGGLVIYPAKIFSWYHKDITS